MMCMLYGVHINNNNNYALNCAYNINFHRILRAPHSMPKEIRPYYSVERGIITTAKGKEI